MKQNLIYLAKQVGIDARKMTVQELKDTFEQTRNQSYSDQFDMMLSEQLNLI